MDRVLKLIYNNRYIINGQEEYLLNGIHPAVIEYINKYYTGSNVSRDKIVDEIQKNNNTTSWSDFFRAGNFIGYYVKHFGRNNIIKIDEIDENDDSSVYVFPVDIGGALDSIFQEHRLTIDSKEYVYNFIQTIDSRVLSLIRKGKVKLVFNFMHDPIFSYHSLRTIEEYLNNQMITSENVFVIPGNNFQEYFKHFPNSKLNITSGRLPLQQAGERLDHYPTVTALGYMSDMVRETDLNSSSLRPKKFLCFNRNLKPHRYFLAYLALKFNLLENSYFSFLVHSGNAQSNIEQSLTVYSGEKEYFQKIYDLVPYHLDTQNVPLNELNGFPTNNNKKDLYLNSYVHITSETIFSEGDPINPFFSEKTFHPIINLQPFIYVGNPYSLKALKDLGFKTFHPLIDESYDNEENPRVRMQLISKEIEKINLMSIEEIHKWYYSITDTLIHNQRQCRSYKDHNPFEETINKIKNYGN